MFVWVDYIAVELFFPNGEARQFYGLHFLCKNWWYEEKVDWRNQISVVSTVMIIDSSGQTV